MPEEDRLRSVELRLERAYELIDALRHESRMFMMDSPQAFGSQIDEVASNGEYVVRAIIHRPPPSRLGMLAADAVHNIRAALDMLAWELALIHPGGPPADDDRTVAFPLCLKPEMWNAGAVKRALGRVHPDAIPIIQALQPYQDDELLKLGFIAAVDNWAKHHAIPTLLTFRVSALEIRSRHRAVGFVDKAFADGDEICRVVHLDPEQPDERYRSVMRCHVSFANGFPADGLPLDALAIALDVVRNRVLPAFTGFFPGGVLSELAAVDRQPPPSNP